MIPPVRVLRFLSIVMIPQFLPGHAKLSKQYTGVEMLIINVSSLTDFMLKKGKRGSHDEKWMHNRMGTYTFWQA